MMSCPKPRRSLEDFFIKNSTESEQHDVAEFSSVDNKNKGILKNSKPVGKMQVTTTNNTSSVSVSRSSSQAINGKEKQGNKSVSWKQTNSDDETNEPLQTQSLIFLSGEKPPKKPKESNIFSMMMKRESVLSSTTKDNEPVVESSLESGNGLSQDSVTNKENVKQGNSRVKKKSTEGKETKLLSAKKNSLKKKDAKERTKPRVCDVDLSVESVDANDIADSPVTNSRKDNHNPVEYICKNETSDKSEANDKVYVDNVDSCLVAIDSPAVSEKDVGDSPKKKTIKDFFSSNIHKKNEFPSKYINKSSNSNDLKENISISEDSVEEVLYEQSPSNVEVQTASIEESESDVEVFYSSDDEQRVIQKKKKTKLGFKCKNKFIGGKLTLKFRNKNCNKKVIGSIGLQETICTENISSVMNNVLDVGAAKERNNVTIENNPEMEVESPCPSAVEPIINSDSSAHEISEEVEQVLDSGEISAKDQELNNSADSDENLDKLTSKMHSLTKKHKLSKPSVAEDSSENEEKLEELTAKMHKLTKKVKKTKKKAVINLVASTKPSKLSRQINKNSTSNNIDKIPHDNAALSDETVSASNEITEDDVCDLPTSNADTVPPAKTINNFFKKVTKAERDSTRDKSKVTVVAEVHSPLVPHPAVETRVDEYGRKCSPRLMKQKQFANVESQCDDVIENSAAEIEEMETDLECKKTNASVIDEDNRRSNKTYTPAGKKRISEVPVRKRCCKNLSAIMDDFDKIEVVDSVALDQSSDSATVVKVEQFKQPVRLMTPNFPSHPKSSVSNKDEAMGGKASTGTPVTENGIEVSLDADKLVSRGLRDSPKLPVKSRDCIMADLTLRKPSKDGETSSDLSSCDVKLSNTCYPTGATEDTERKSKLR